MSLATASFLFLLIPQSTHTPNSIPGSPTAIELGTYNSKIAEKVVMEILPDGKLVYLYCSSIFNGENAKIRKSKKVVQMLEDHKHAIRLLKKQFSVQAIAAVVKDLLEKQIFESIPRAKLRFPELFKTSKTQEAKRAALQASITAMEAKTADARATRSDDEEARDHPDLKEGHAEKMSDIAVKSPDRAHFTVLDLR